MSFPRSVSRFGFVLLASGLLTGPGLGLRAQAQEPRNQGANAQRGRADRPQGATPARAPELRAETFRLIDAYFISNLQESLGLSDEQFARALPLVKKLQSDRREFAMKRMEALRALRRSLNSGAATEGQVGDLLREVKNAVTGEREATRANMDALDAVLTPLQQAKFRVFEAEVDVRLRRLRERGQDRARPNLP